MDKYLHSNKEKQLLLQNVRCNQLVYRHSIEKDTYSFKWTVITQPLNIEYGTNPRYEPS